MIPRKYESYCNNFSFKQLKNYQLDFQRSWRHHLKRVTIKFITAPTSHFIVMPRATIYSTDGSTIEFH